MKTKKKIPESRFKKIRGALRRLEEAQGGAVKRLVESAIFDSKMEHSREGVLRDRHSFSSRNIHESFPVSLILRFKDERLRRLQEGDERMKGGDEFELPPLTEIDGDRL